MKCNRCKIEEADLSVNEVALCYDCALEEGDEAVAAAKFHAELYAAREENRQLHARVQQSIDEITQLRAEVERLKAEHGRLLSTLSWRSGLQ